MRTKSLAVILTLLLGATGAQWFYLRSPIIGAIWFCTFSLAVLLIAALPPLSAMLMLGLGITALIQAIWLATLGADRFNAEYNAELARCTECSEVIQRAARKCKHCGASIESAAPWLKPQPKVAQQPQDLSHLVR